MSLHTDHPADLDPALLGRVTPDDMRAAATWLLDGYEYDADDDLDANAPALARVGRWLLAEADRRETDAAIRALARRHNVPVAHVRATYRTILDRADPAAAQELEQQPPLGARP